MSPPPTVAGGSRRREKRSRRGSRKRDWLRILLLLLCVAGPGYIGYQTRPQVQEAPELVGPSIVILASQKGLAATVNQVLQDGPGAGGPSTLQLTVLPASTVSGTVTLTVELDNFPDGTTEVSGTNQNLTVIHALGANSAYGTLAQSAPPPAPEHQDYAVNETITATTSSDSITIKAPNAEIGEGTSGAQLRVAFPDLVGEAPGANPTAGYQLQNLFSGALASQSGTAKVYPPTLQAGSSIFYPAGTSLSDYQILAGDSPAPYGSGWRWDGVNDISVLAANVKAEDKASRYLFYSGVAFGLAAGALISLFVELIAPDKDNDKDNDNRDEDENENEDTEQEPGQPPPGDAHPSG